MNCENTQHFSNLLILGNCPSCKEGRDYCEVKSCGEARIKGEGYCVEHWQDARMNQRQEVAGR